MSDEAEYKFLAGQNQVYRGSLNEQRLRYYNTQAGSNETSVESAELAFLKKKTGLNLNSKHDLWRTYLSSLGVTNVGSLGDMKAAFWGGVGNSYSHDVVLSDFSNDALASQQTGFVRTSPNACVRFTTTATTMTVHYYSENYVSSHVNNAMGLWVDGVFQELINPSAAGAGSKDVTMAAGSKTVEIVTAYCEGSSYHGCTPTKIVTNATITIANVTANPMYILGDSISCGASADNPPGEGYAVLVRSHRGFTKAVYNDSYGGRALPSNGAAQDAIVTAIASKTPDFVWIALGANNTESAVDFQTLYESFLTKLHTALATTPIYCMSVINDNSYDTAIDNACDVAGAGGYAYFVDATGTGWPSAGDTADGTHPNTTGHGMVATKINAILDSPPTFPIAPPFTPTDLDNRLFWLDPGQEAYSNNDPVGTFNDQFGTNDFSQGTAGRKPLFKTNVLNSLPVIRFDGSDDGLKAASALLPSGDFTLFIVMKNTTSQTDFSCPFDQSLAAPDKNFGLQYQTYSAGYLCFSGSNNTDYRIKGYVSTDTNWHIVTRHQSSGTGKIYLDGTLATISTVAAGPAYGSDITSWSGTPSATASDRDDTKLGYLGLDDDSYRDRFWDGDIAEVIAYSDALSAGELTSVHTYLQSKYGL